MPVAKSYVTQIAEGSIPYLKSYESSPISCQICPHVFKSYEPASWFALEASPRCRSCTPSLSPLNQAGWQVVMIMVINPKPQYLPSPIGTPAPNPSEIPRLCESCNILSRPAGKCGKCRATVCMYCWDVKLRRCSLYCPFRTCDTCDSLHNCPNIVYTP